MGLFSGCLFACDIDGTLMINGVINPRNIERVKFLRTRAVIFRFPQADRSAR